MIDTALSDHRTVLCSLSLRKPSRAKQQVKSRNLRRIDPTRFQTDVSQVASPLAECYDSELLVHFAASLRTTELLGNGKKKKKKVPFYLVAFLILNFLIFFFLFFFCFFFDQNSYLFEVDLSLNLLAILAYHMLLFAVSFVASSQCRKILFTNLSMIPPQTVVNLNPFRPLCSKHI